MISYEYKGYTIYYNDTYYVYLGKNGTKRADFSSDIEVEEFIDELITDQMYDINSVDLYNNFVRYCTKLPGKCFFDGKIATYNKKALNNFIKPFERSNDCTVLVDSINTGGEYYYVVTEIV